MTKKHIIVLLFFTAIFSIIATAILSYISMAVMIGPWIESTIALLASSLLIMFIGRSKFYQYNQSIALVTAGASIGGIVSVGAGFAFPTLYFLDKQLFTSWLNSPLYFFSIMAALTFGAGSLGLLIADFFSNKLLKDKNLPFPIGEMTYKLISSQNNFYQSLKLSISFIISFIYSIYQALFLGIPKAVTIFSEYSYSWFVLPRINIPMAELPMLASIGLIAGTIIAVPLTIGILTKIFITMPIYNKYFLDIQQIDFNFSFCSGLMLYSTFTSLLFIPKSLPGLIKQIYSYKFKFKPNIRRNISIKLAAYWAPVLIFLVSFFTYFHFSLLSQIYILIFTIISAYQLIIIAGEIGLAPLARFATFVMIPGLILFKLNYTQVMVVSVFVEIAGGVAVDSLFGLKTGQLFNIDSKKTKLFQWFGLLITSISIGFIFYVLISHLGIGSSQLLAQRSQTRALTIQFHEFNFFGVILGSLFSAILKEFKINPIMVLGGILMPLDWSIILSFFGLISYFIKNNEQNLPIYSGLFSANSIWMILYSLYKAI